MIFYQRIEKSRLRNNPQAAFMLSTLNFLLYTFFIILSIELSIKSALNLINLLIGKRYLMPFKFLAEMQGNSTLKGVGAT